MHLAAWWRHPVRSIGDEPLHGFELTAVWRGADALGAQGSTLLVYPVQSLPDKPQLPYRGIED